MSKTLLLTSFDTWKPQHRSNSSDDLLDLLGSVPPQWHLLRNLPVDFDLAPFKVMTALQRIQPQVVVCCGMAETRHQLAIESNGKYQTTTLHTDLDLPQLINGLCTTEISHDAGRFVCNHLYYSVLQFLRHQAWNCSSLFVHVPILTEQNRAAIVQDFTRLLHRLAQAEV